MRTEIQRIQRYGGGEGGDRHGMRQTGRGREMKERKKKDEQDRSTGGERVAQTSNKEEKTRNNIKKDRDGRGGRIKGEVLGRETKTERGSISTHHNHF